MIVSAVYLLVRCLLSCLMVLARGEVSTDVELLMLRHENAVLRRQTGRVRYQPGDRLWLAALSRLVPRCRWGEVFTVAPATLFSWHRRLIARKWDYSWRRSPGRPSTTAAIRKLVIRMATDNPGWGHRRVQGELVKLGHPIAASAVWQILHDAGIGPVPRRTGPTWKQFLGRAGLDVQPPALADELRLIAWTVVPARTSTPWAASSAWTRAPSSGSTVSSTSGTCSIWVTARPRTVRASAISRPIYSAPTMTVLAGVENYQFPLIADERQAGSTVLQRLALVDVETDREVWSWRWRACLPGCGSCSADICRVFSLPGLGDVPDQRQVEMAGRSRHRAEADFDRERGSVFAQPDQR